MTLHLNAQAFYVVDGDAVVGEVHVFDPDDDKYHPEAVRSGRCDLLYKGTTIRFTEFDYRYGNSDGVFHVQFSHPSAIDDLAIKVVVTAQDGSSLRTLQYSVGVQRETASPLPMSEQPTTGPDANGELRARRRIEENL